MFHTAQNNFWWALVGVSSFYGIFLLVEYALLINNFKFCQLRHGLVTTKANGEKLEEHFKKNDVIRVQSQNVYSKLSVPFWGMQVQW